MFFVNRNDIVVWGVRLIEGSGKMRRSRGVILFLVVPLLFIILYLAIDTLGTFRGIIFVFAYIIVGFMVAGTVWGFEEEMRNQTPDDLYVITCLGHWLGRKYKEWRH